jgi:hypothetical protein
LAETDPPLDGTALTVLATALAGAFAADDLEEAVLVALDEELYTEFAAPGTPIAPLALELVKGLKQRGWVLRFFRAARKRRPDNAPLIAAIQQCCPSAMQDAPSAAGEVLVLVDALTVMKARLADPDVASAVGASQDEFGSLAEQLARLRTYKGLHDTLQDFQVGQFSSLSDCVKRLRADPGASVILRDLLNGSLRAFQNARMTLQPLEAAHDDVEEKSCLDEFIAAFDALRKARDLLDDRAARLALVKIRGLLQSHPSRINSALRTEARRLPLQGLRDTIEAAARAAGLTPEQRTSIQEGAQSVGELRLRLTRSVIDHDRWQGVERNLWLLDGTVDRGDGALDEFRDYWDITKESVAPLWNADVKAAWAIATGDLAKAIDAALAGNPPDPPRARGYYGDFRHAAMWQFYEVDRELRVLCEDVLQIGAPVVALVKRT